jgi:hypothetical protein
MSGDRPDQRGAGSGRPPVGAWNGESADVNWPRDSRSGFFNFQSRTLSSIAAINSHDYQTEITANPTTHKLRATVKKTIRNAILKI